MSVWTTWVARVGGWRQLVSDLDRGRRRYGLGWGALVRRLVTSYREGGFHPRQALACGLLDPRVTAEVSAGCISKDALEAHQARFNPSAWECLTEDKSVFYSYCASVGLPVPHLLAVFDRPAGRLGSGEVLTERAEWVRFFAEQLPDTFVAKPALGVFGWGVGVFRRTEGGFLGTSGKTITPPMLYALLSGHKKYQKFVLQDRVRNHPELERLSGTSNLQTVRIVTWLGDDGAVDLFVTEAKIIVGDRLTDNYVGGTRGNLIANIALDGTLGPGIGADPEGIGFRAVESHPDTGVRFEGFTVPRWDEACALVRRAARLFLPLRTIGWDVAITPDGPVLIEGNAWWDPVNELVIGPQAAGERRCDMRKLLAAFGAR